MVSEGPAWRGLRPGAGQVDVGVAAGAQLRGQAQVVHEIDAESRIGARRGETPPHRAGARVGAASV